MALPLATLLAAIMTMGNLGENYELLAMKSAGMSLPKIMRPLLVVVSILAVSSFLHRQQLSAIRQQKFFRTIYDIRQMNQTLEFQDGLLQRHRRHEHPRRTPESGNRAADRRTDLRQPQRIGQYDHDRRRFGLYPALGRQALSEITLFNGERYEQTRNSSQWYNKSSLQRNKFEPSESQYFHFGIRNAAHGCRSVQQRPDQKHLRACNTKSTR